MIKTPFKFFHREANRWHNIVHQVTGLGKKKKASAKHVRVVFRDKQKAILSKLIFLYGPEQGHVAFGELERIMSRFLRQKPSKLKRQDAAFKPIDRFTEKDVVLITYPDTVFEPNDVPLSTLKRFADRRLLGLVSTIHILPFYPYSSDRGFSVKNYDLVNKKFGTWEDIAALSENFNLMFDGVFNHVSSQSRWFRAFLHGDREYENYFIHCPSRSSITPEQMAKIVRPRTTELLSEYERKDGKVFLWTTFSRDQIDLNYREPKVLLEVIDALFLYIAHGAKMVRLDAVNYLWKEPGTTCSHLRQTHVIIQLFRDVLDIVAPSVALITETNVPHARNTSYFGNGSVEAQMVYNFSLPPLVLYTIYKGNCRILSNWASRLRYPEYGTYFNFLASHDGIGLTPAKRLLPKKEVDFLIGEAKKHGSLVQQKRVGLKKEVPYELNITWWNAVNRTHQPFQVVRYLATRAIALSLKGVPGIYFHSLFGTKNDTDAYKKSMVNRDINRKNISLDELEEELSEDTLPRMIFRRFMHLVRVRSAEKAFHPAGEQHILVKNDFVFSVLRVSPDRKERVLSAINVTDRDQEYHVKCSELGLNPRRLVNIIKNKPLTHERIMPEEFTVRLKPYQVFWLKSY